MLLLTNCTFDGVVYDPLRVMDEVLAIKPDMVFLWDEAWFAFAIAVPFARAAHRDDGRRGTCRRRWPRRPTASRYASTWRTGRRWTPTTTRAGSTTGCCPTRTSARVRVYATHSTHKSLSALRQASMIHVRDQDFARDAEAAFDEAFLTHTTTSPNYQMLASLDLARRQVDLEGLRPGQRAYEMALRCAGTGPRRPAAQQVLLRSWSPRT